MKKFLPFGLIFYSFILFSVIKISAQPWSYNFGTSTGSYTTASSSSTSFLPTPSSGTARVRVGSAGGGFHLSLPGLSGFGSDTELRIVAAASTSVNKFSIYDYIAGKSFALRFSVRFGASDGTPGVSSGQFQLFVGDGTTYSDNSGFNGSQVFTGLQWIFGTGGSTTTEYRNGTVWTEISGAPFSQGTNYVVDIYGNNTTSTLNYNYGVSQSVAPNKFDLWINGTLVGDDLNKAGISNDVNLDSWMFIGQSSLSNAANIFIDDIFYTNEIPSDPLPVELSSFTANLFNKNILLTWETKTETNNYGFEIERSSSLEPGNASSLPKEWEKIGFVGGSGNSNSPKGYLFIDNTLTKSGKYSYRLKQIDSDGSYSYSKEVEVDYVSVDKFSLYQNYPNPFNPSTVISYQIPVSGRVSMKVYDILGKEIVTLVDEYKEAGRYEVEFNVGQTISLSFLSSGMYFYKLQVEDYVEVKKMILAK
jgi:hypothetical protein